MCYFCRYFIILLEGKGGVHIRCINDSSIYSQTHVPKKLRICNSTDFALLEQIIITAHSKYFAARYVASQIHKDMNNMGTLSHYPSRTSTIFEHLMGAFYKSISVRIHRVIRQRENKLWPSTINQINVHMIYCNQSIGLFFMLQLGTAFGQNGYEPVL